MVFDSLPVPSDKRISALCMLLERNIHHEETKRRYAPVKQVLTMIGIAGAVVILLVAPSTAVVAKVILDEKRKIEWDQRKKFSDYYLNQSIRRLKNQKLVTVSEVDGKEVVVLSKFGKRKILKYALNELTIEKPKSWDGRWGMVIYDVDSHKKYLRDVFRKTLQSLGFHKLQESVWLFPYPCEEQIAFLREYYDVGNEVLYLVAIKLEDDTPYREYFGLV